MKIWIRLLQRSKVNGEKDNQEKMLKQKKSKKMTKKKVMAMIEIMKRINQ